MNAQAHFQTLNNPESYRFEFVTCSLCGEQDHRLLLVGQEDLTGKPGNFQYVVCDGCGLSYQNPRIHMDQIKEFYDSEYIAHRKKTDWGILTGLYERAMGKHDRDKGKLVRRFVKLDQNSRVLDVGCAVGSFLLHVKDKYGCAIHGVDFKDELDFPRFDEVVFHDGLFYEQGNLEAGSFDLVTMWHFLEHCYDPKRSLAKAREVLVPRGRLVIEVPRLDSVTYKLFKNKWPGVQAPQHTVMFDRQHFEQIVRESGFRIVKYMAYGAFPAYFYLFAGTYFKLLGKGLRLDRAALPYFIGQLLLWPLLVFERKLNLAMQTIVCERID